MDTRVDRGARRRAVFSTPTVTQLSKDFTLRNILVTTKNKDNWMFHKKHSLGNDVLKCFTMQSPLPHKPNLLCVKAYATMEIPPRELGAIQGSSRPSNGMAWRW